ncbi:MAG: ComF family protein [Rhizobiaceae bacterium]|nr:ComF family protein [Rhizobiaceae bacterium]
MRPMAGRLGGFGSVVLSAVADMLFPPVCPGCRIAIGSLASVCPDCWASIGFIDRPYCEVLGLPFAYDQGPGALSPAAIADPPPFARLRAAVLYRGLAATFVASLKYSDRTDLSVLMAAWMGRAGADLIADADIVVPVPLHRGRLWRRRFNQSAELARHIVAAGGEVSERRAAPLAYSPLALVRVKPTRSQIGLGARERRENVRGAFQVPADRRAEIAGRRVLLVDDVFTTGATVSSATRTLMRGGAASVDVLTFARVAAEG